MNRWISWIIENEYRLVCTRKPLGLILKVLEAMISIHSAHGDMPDQGGVVVSRSKRCGSPDSLRSVKLGRYPVQQHPIIPLGPLRVPCSSK